MILEFVSIFAVGYLWFYHTGFILKDSGTLTKIQNMEDSFDYGKLTSLKIIFQSPLYFFLPLPVSDAKLEGFG